MRSVERQVFWLIALLVVANGFDLVATIYFLERGWMVEANPFMAAAYRISPLAFAAVKLALISCFGVLLFFTHTHARDPRGFIKKGLFLIIVPYIAVSLYQMFYVIHALAQ